MVFHLIVLFSVLTYCLIVQPVFCAVLRPVPTYLQNEMSAVAKSQQHILNFLSNKNIHIGHQPVSISKFKPLSDINDRILLSTKENPLECRITLGKAPEGSVCVAPCGCTGSQNWIQFSEYNKLRRSDPSQWQVCKTCQQPFQIEPFTRLGGVRSNLIGTLLDNMNIIRSAGVLSAFITSYVVDLNGTINRVLTSRILWQNHQHWSKLMNTPLALKFMLGRIAFDQLAAWYSQLERATIFAYLTDVETALIEEGLAGSVSARSVIETDTITDDNNT